MRDAGLTDRFFKLSSTAVDQMARGLMDTAEQAKMADAVVDAFGNYSRFSPGQRRLIAEYTPFLAWVASSANFVVRVLPRDHPAMMALLTVNASATEDWRKAMGLDTLPDWLTGTLRTSRQGTQWQVTRNTPFGAFSGNLSETAGDLFLPQLIPAVTAMQHGIDWRGYKLPDQSAGGRAAYALEEMVKSSIPAIAVYNKGQTYFEDPGKTLSAVRQPPYKPKRKAVRRRKGDLPALPQPQALPDLPRQPHGAVSARIESLSALRVPRHASGLLRHKRVERMETSMHIGTLSNAERARSAVGRERLQAPAGLTSADPRPGSSPRADWPTACSSTGRSYDPRAARRSRNA